MDDIQLFKAHYETEECLEEIRKCLEIGWTGLGFKTVEFENAWKEYLDIPNAHFLNSATAGLNLAVNILKEENGWEDEDEVITTPITFVSTNHAIIRNGLKAVFADIDDTFCLSPESVVSRITPRTRAVMYVGLGGNPGNFDKIKEICKENGLIFIVDAAHMAGTRKADGSNPCKDVEVAVYSFQAVKNLPTADGGMICFKSKEYDSIARKKSWLGIDKDTYTRTVEKGTYKWQYDVKYVGDKFHGNSIMAAIGLVQLKYLDRDNEYRRQLTRWYKEALKPYAGDKLQTVRMEDGYESSCHLFQILVDKRNDLMVELNNNHIYPGVHYNANTNYGMYSYAKGTCPFADHVSEHTISLPMHIGVTKEDVERVAGVIGRFLDN